MPIIEEIAKELQNDPAVVAASQIMVETPEFQRCCHMLELECRAERRVMIAQLLRKMTHGLSLAVKDHNEGLWLAVSGSLLAFIKRFPEIKSWEIEANGRPN